MKITRIRAYRVALPLHEGSYKWSGGKSASVFDSTLVEVESWAAAGPTLLVVPRADPQAPAPDPAAWSHIAVLVAHTTKPDGQPCDDIYRVCPPPGCAASGPAPGAREVSSR